MILRNPRVLLVCVGIAFAVLAAVSLRFFSQQGPQSGFSTGSLLGGTEQVALEADDVQVVGHSAGKVRWRMTAQTVTLSRDRRVVTIQGIRRGALYASDSHPSVLLTADQAQYTTPFGVLGLSGAGALQVQGHVEASVQSPAHPSFRTSQIVWNSASNLLSCPAPVTALLPRLLVTAGSAQFLSPPGAPAQGVMRLSGGVHARFSSTHGPVTADCPGLTWDASGQNAQTTGPVTATIPGGIGTATADEMEANTRTGDLSSRGLRGTLRLSPGVQ